MKSQIFSAQYHSIQGSYLQFRDKICSITGNFLSVDSTKPFRHLQQFGSTFLNRFEASQSNSEALKSVTLLDTPGILSGEKQVVNRGYDFAGVLKWFAERADKIILLFDAHKLDISDEFKQAIQAIRYTNQGYPDTRFFQEVFCPLLYTKIDFV